MEPKYKNSDFVIISKKFNYEFDNIITKIISYLNWFDSMIKSNDYPGFLKEQIKKTIDKYYWIMKNKIEERQKIKKELNNINNWFIERIPNILTEIQEFSKYIKNERKEFEKNEEEEKQKIEKKELKKEIEIKKKRIEKIKELIPNYLEKREKEINVAVKQKQKQELKKEKKKRQEKNKKKSMFTKLKTAAEPVTNPIFNVVKSAYLDPAEQALDVAMEKGKKIKNVTMETGRKIKKYASSIIEKIKPKPKPKPKPMSKREAFKKKFL